VTIAKAHLRVTATAGAAFEMVADMVRPLLGEETEAKLPILFTGMQDVESAQIGIDLWACPAWSSARAWMVRSVLSSSTRMPRRTPPGAQPGPALSNGTGTGA